MAAQAVCGRFLLGHTISGGEFYFGLMLLRAMDTIPLHDFRFSVQAPARSNMYEPATLRSLRSLVAVSKTNIESQIKTASFETALIWLTTIEEVITAIKTGAL